MRSAVEAALRVVLPPGIGLGVFDPGEPATLWPGEELPGAVPRRLQEFAAGRAAARAAMVELGYHPAAIPMGHDRAPVWPAALLGSISHSPSLCVAIIGSADQWQGLGIDIEPETPLEPELWPTILVPAEIAGVDGLTAKRIFAAKEAVYKAQYAQSRHLFGYEALRIFFDDDRFTAEFQMPISPFHTGQQMPGRILSAGGHVVAVCVLPR